MPDDLRDIIGYLPYRMALAGGWIDQPFVSRHDPSPPGSMVVASLEPFMKFMDRCGMATGTRYVAMKIWYSKMPEHRSPEQLVRELYDAENRGKIEPSGSQDMIGMIYPGISRLDYDFSYEGGIFPKYIESTSDPEIVRWLEDVLYVLPVSPRPMDYNPLGRKNVEPPLVRALGQSGRDCWDAIVTRDLRKLGKSFNDCVAAYEKLLPDTLRHSSLTFDLVRFQEYYQQRYAGAMYSGCGGGYIYVAADEPVPGAFKMKIRV